MFLDDSAIVGLITDGDDREYRELPEILWTAASRTNFRSTLKNQGAGGRFLQAQTSFTTTTEYSGYGHEGCVELQVPWSE